MHLLPQPVQFFIAVVIAYLADDIAINDEEHDFGDLPPCLYKSANVDGTFSVTEASGIYSCFLMMSAQF